MRLKGYNPIFFITIMLFILIFTYRVSAEVTKEIVVFNFQINKIYALIFTCLLFIFINAFNFYTDKIIVSLMISAVLGLVPLLYAENTSNYLGNYLPLLISLSTYFICLQVKGDIADKIYKLIILASLIISFQVIYTEWSFFSGLSLSNFSNVEIKGSMNIPIGSSNLIASFLLPMMVFIFVYRRNLFSISTLSICLYALILCRSKNALILLLALLVLMPLFKLLKYIFLDKTVGIFIKLILIGMVFSFFAVIFHYLSKLIDFLVLDLSFNYFSSIANPFLNKLDNLSSGRVTVYLEQLDRFSQHIFFGNGFGYNIGQTKSHNWILDLLVQKGIIGMLLYIYSIVLVLKIGVTYRKDVFVQSITYSLVVFLIQGLFEITLFTPGIDFFIWSLAGLLIARVRYIKSLEMNE